MNGDQIRQKEDRLIIGAESVYNRSFHLDNHDVQFNFDANPIKYLKWIPSDFYKPWQTSIFKDDMFSVLVVISHRLAVTGRSYQYFSQ